MKSHLFAVCSRAHLCIFDRSNSPPLLACSDPALAWNNFHTEDNHRSKVLPLHFLFKSIYVAHISVREQEVNGSDLESSLIFSGCCMML